MNRTSVMGITCVAIVLGVLAPFGSLQAGDDKNRGELVRIINAIEKGWEQADGKPFREHFLDFEGARYIETGGQNEGLDDLVGHHVEPEADAFTNFDLVFDNIETHVEGDFAWAIVNVELIAELKRDGRKIHNRGYSTFLFRRIDNAWKVIHTHNSSRPVKPK